MLFLAPNKNPVSVEVDRLIPKHHAVQTVDNDDMRREETILFPSELQLMAIDYCQNAADLADENYAFLVARVGVEERLEETDRDIVNSQDSYK